MVVNYRQQSFTSSGGPTASIYGSTMSNLNGYFEPPKFTCSQGPTCHHHSLEVKSPPMDDPTVRTSASAQAPFLRLHHTLVLASASLCLGPLSMPCRS